MNHKSRNTINRKEFLRRSVGGLIGLGAAGLSAPSIVQRAHAAGTIQYRTLGKTGLKVCPVGFGGSRTNEPSIFKMAIDMGINFIDTGRMYSGGRNEELIGKVVKDIRKNIIIQSKIDQKIQSSKAAMEKSIDDSLRALQTDYVDIMLVRGATTEEAVKNPVVLETFVKVKEAGKIRFCGFSCHSANAHEMLRFGADTKVYDIGMVPYNHAGNFRHTVYGIYSEWDQVALEKSFEYAVSKGMGIVAMKTCSGGPFKADDNDPGSFPEGLAWILRNKNVGVMAVGMGSFREVEDDFGAMG
ncbi:aldo/keto reductase [bacterium]|nr:aldo/keto reductase [bacterium]